MGAQTDAGGSGERRPYEADLDDLLLVLRHAWRNLHELLVAVNAGGERWRAAWERQETVVRYLLYRLGRLRPPPRWRDCHNGLHAGLRLWAEAVRPLAASPDSIDATRAREALVAVHEAGAAIEHALRSAPDGRGLPTVELCVPPLSESLA
jgi:hypothetical protein